MKTAKKKDLTLPDILSHLHYTEACRLLGAGAKELLRTGGCIEIELDDVFIGPRVLDARVGAATVRIFLREDANKRVGWRCSHCDGTCVHVGAVFALVLEEKLSLGLARPPVERVPIESLSEAELVEQALADREERAKSERMTLRSSQKSKLWTDYTIRNAASGKTYRLALRGAERGQSYCSCPDFRSNRLGTCKHIMQALRKLRRRFSAATFAKPYKRKRFALYLSYAEDVELRLALPDKLDPKAKRIVKPIMEGAIHDLPDLLDRVRKLERLGHEVALRPDAEEFIDQSFALARLERLSRKIRKNSAKHPLRKKLLHAELRPYQLEGIAFCIAAGRAVLADDMGLGKTIQAIGVAEVLAREVGIERVLIVCPASVKSQWANEIERFCDRDVQVVLGSAESRAEQYRNAPFFSICNYEQVLRDGSSIEAQPWDLIILDEGQRIKNWEAKTTRSIKSLRSRYALVLSGTPLENRLDELYSVVQFIDDRRLAPAYRFYNSHRVVDERGRVLGYKKLDELRKTLAPILLRRTREAVLDELPERTTEIRRIPPSQEQADMHAGHLSIVSSIVRKAYISEMDLLRLQKALLMCRMSADGTFLVDKQQPGYSTKLEELREVLTSLLSEDSRKIVLFSEWTSMLDRIEEILLELDVDYVRLDGSVPQKKRLSLVRQFQKDDACRLFLSTNAGSVGLNLQAADTIVNVDLPWNPAILEQRIGRAHRMGQKRPVHVVILVTEDTIEERMLATLSAKHELACAALDAESKVDEVDLSSGVEELKRRLEQLVGRKPEAPIDERSRADAERESNLRKERVSLAGGQLLSSAMSFLTEVLPRSSSPEPRGRPSSELLSDCLSRDSKGRPTLTVTLPDDAAMERLTASLAELIHTLSPAHDAQN